MVKLKIVVLDGYTLNPGDLDWNGIEAFGDTKVYEHTPEDLIVERAKGAEIVFTNKTPLTAETMDKLEGLRYIGVLATGYNVVDVKGASDRGVVVTNIPTYGTHSVAQMVFAHILELCRHVQIHSDAVRNGEWSNCRDFCFWKTPQVELYGKTIGIVGFGNIGRQVGEIADAMGMRVIAYDKIENNPPDFEGFRWVSLEELFKESDVISLHCPLFPRQKG